MATGESAGFGYVDDLGFFRLEGFAIRLRGSGEITLWPDHLEHPGLSPESNWIGCELVVEVGDRNGGIQWRTAMRLYVRVTDLASFACRLEQVHADARDSASLDLQYEFRPAEREARITVRRAPEVPHGLIAECRLATPQRDWDRSRWEPTCEHLAFHAFGVVEIRLDREWIPTTCSEIGAVMRAVRES